MRNLIPGLVLSIVVATEGQAQRLSDRAALANAGRGVSTIRVDPVRQDGDGSSTGAMLGGGFAGVLAGAAIGALIGYHVADEDQCDYFCGVVEAVLGAAIGEAVGIPLGVRMAGGRGSLPAQIVVSAGVLFVGAWAAPVTRGLSLLPIIPLQLHLVIRDAKPESNRTEKVSSGVDLQ